MSERPTYQITVSGPKHEDLTRIMRVFASLFDSDSEWDRPRPKTNIVFEVVEDVLDPHLVL